VPNNKKVKEILNLHNKLDGKIGLLFYWIDVIKLNDNFIGKRFNQAGRQAILSYPF